MNYHGVCIPGVYVFLLLTEHILSAMQAQITHLPCLLPFNLKNNPIEYVPFIILI